MTVTQVLMAEQTLEMKSIPPTGTTTHVRTSTVFQARSLAKTQQVLQRLGRRERIVLMLLDGHRTIEDVMKLLHRGEQEIVQSLTYLFQHGYIDYRGDKKGPSNERTESIAWGEAHS